MKGTIRGRITRTSKPNVLPSGNDMTGIKPCKLVRARTLTHRMRYRFFYAAKMMGLTVEMAENPAPEMVPATADMGEQEVLRQDYLRKEYIRENANWGAETYFVIFGSSSMKGRDIKCFLEDMVDELVVSTESVLDVRAPRGSKPPAMHMPSPPAKRENGQRIPTVAQQHPDYKFKSLYAQNS